MIFHKFILHTGKSPLNCGCLSDDINAICSLLYHFLQTPDLTLYYFESSGQTVVCFFHNSNDIPPRGICQIGLSTHLFIVVSVFIYFESINFKHVQYGNKVGQEVEH